MKKQQGKEGHGFAARQTEIQGGRACRATQSSLFLASQADLARRIGGSFSSHTHIGSGAKVIYGMMEQVMGMNMAGLRPFNVKEQILDSGGADRVCLDYGKSLAEKF